MSDTREITSAKYVYDLVNYPGEEIIGGVLAIIDGEQRGVPMDENNTDYQLILAWVADGNTITPAT